MRVDFHIIFISILPNEIFCYDTNSLTIKAFEIQINITDIKDKLCTKDEEYKMNWNEAIQDLQKKNGVGIGRWTG